MDYKLYSFWRSSCSWRVRIVLAYKNVSYTVLPVNLLEGIQYKQEFKERNSMNQVPILQIGDSYITQSIAIFHYLEDKYPHPSMIPNGFEKYRMWEIVEIINSGIQPMQNVSILNMIEKCQMDKLIWAQNVINKGFEAIEKILKDTSGKYAVGDELSFADACIVPQGYNALSYGVKLESFPVLYSIYKNALHHPSIQASHPKKQQDSPVKK